MGAPKQTEQASGLSAFAQKAAQRLQDKKTIKHRTIHVPSWDMDIKIRNLTNAEIVDITNLDTRADDLNYADKYTIYTAVVEPDLRAEATALKQSGVINEYIEVVNSLDYSEISSLAIEIMRLSGVMDGATVTVVDDLKNS